MLYYLMIVLNLELRFLGTFLSKYLVTAKIVRIFMYMKKVEKIIVTHEEIKMATRPNIYRNKKKYTRKEKARSIWLPEE